MAIRLTHESRSALSRARFFLNKAKACPIDERVDFEAFVEAAIVFGRAAIHRKKTQYKGQPAWKAWWDSLLGDPAVDFFRSERDRILKESSARLGQKIFVPSIGSTEPSNPPKYAAEFYYFDDPQVPATDTIEQQLNNLSDRLEESERQFFGKYIAG
ncbi:MAG: hypothetical protein WBD99_02360 [Thermodesulfobacteriota bacterium]